MKPKDLVNQLLSEGDASIPVAPISVFVPDTLEWEAVDAAAAELVGASAYGVGNGVYLKGTREQLRKLLSNEDFTIEWYGGTLTPEQIESMLEENE